MGFRTLVITKRCKLDYRLNYLQMRSEDGTQMVFIEEVDTVIFESVATTCTTYLLQELISRKVKVVFCDRFHQPLGEIVPYHGSFDAAKKLAAQAAWDGAVKANLWQLIMRRKISLQAVVLTANGLPTQAELLTDLVDHVLPGDTSNIEARAARLYFAALFGQGFNRRSPDSLVNSCLNYGYTIVLSNVNRAIAAAGYSTLLGIFHHGPENSFNLGSDLMEPLRPLVDHWILACRFETFDTNTKHQIVDLLNQQVEINATNHYLGNAIELYVRSALRYIEEPGSEVTFCSLIDEVPPVGGPL
jgi:CRISPR-associated endonuclease Cas1 subtype II